MKYFVRANNDHEYTVEFKENNNRVSVFLDGNRLDVTFNKSPRGSGFNMLVDNRPYSGVAYEKDLEEGLEIEINGERFHMKVTNEIQKLITDLGIGEDKEDMVNSVVAPMPGLVVKIEVAEGEQVNEGDGVIIVEAMKMENELKSPRSGKVKHLAVNVGDSVDQGQLLITFE